MRRSLLCLLVAACGGDESTTVLVDAPSNLCPLVGAHSNQTLVLGDNVEDRAYFLYVPPAIRCDQPVGLLVDFHGTAGDPAPEEAYGHDELLALADAYGFILARPRSRSRVTNGTRFYQWDINTGDIPRNEKFAKKLVDDLAARFPIDRARVYASGFSSGSNMAARFLFDPALPFKGIAPMAGGAWISDGLPPLGATSPRVYLATGYRDYLWTYTRNTSVDLLQNGLPADRLFVRRSAGGHELHGYYFEEAWRFFDQGERPSTGGTIAAPWTAEASFETADVNALVADGTTMVAAAANGRLWRRSATGLWTMEREQPGADYVTACFSGARGFVGGSYAGAARATTTWQDTTIPDYGMLGQGWINGVDCRADGSLVVVGYWSAAISSDGGATWSRFQLPTGFGVDAQGASVATSPGGATVVAGYYYLGRAPAGTTATARMHTGNGWFNAVTALPNGRFWAVGDKGVIMTSADDGRTWSSQQSNTTMDLYAVHFIDTQVGAAVGRAGTVLVTKDGGATWTKRPLGRTSYLGAVRVDATQIWIAGEDGIVASSPR